MGESPGDGLEHEIAVLRPEPGDVLVLYAPYDPGRRTDQRLSPTALREFFDRFLDLAFRAGCWPLIVRGPREYPVVVERWDERTARVAYETLKRAFEGERDG